MIHHWKFHDFHEEGCHLMLSISASDLIQKAYRLSELQLKELYFLKWQVSNPQFFSILQDLVQPCCCENIHKILHIYISNELSLLVLQMPVKSPSSRCLQQTRLTSSPSAVLHYPVFVSKDIPHVCWCTVSSLHRKSYWVTILDIPVLRRWEGGTMSLETIFHWAQTVWF